jgi:glycosyltransferase involved in cell wall biosynthesis
MGHQVNMVTSWRDSHDGDRWFVTDEDGITVHWLPLPYSNHMSFWKRIKTFFLFALFAANKARSLPTDLVFATSTPLTIALPAVYAARRNNVPMVFEVRDLWPEIPIELGVLNNPLLRILAKMLAKFAYQSSEAIIALSPGIFEGIVRVGYPASRVAIIPNGSDIHHVKPCSSSRATFRALNDIRDDQILVLYAGAVGCVNGVSYLVHLAAMLIKDSRFLFLVVGDGNDFNNVTELARNNYVLNHNFRITNSIPKNDIPGLLAAADIATSLFIPLKSMESNSANKFFDGLSAGCCIAINYGGWQSHLLSSSGAGIQLDRDFGTAACQLQTLANDLALIEHSKLASRKLAEEHFSYDLLAPKLVNVFERALLDFASPS